MSALDKKAFLAHDVFVFDVDDTLLYTFRNGFCKINAMARELHLPQITFSAYQAHYGVDTFLDCLRCWFPAADNHKLLEDCYAAQSTEIPYQPVCNFASLQQLLGKYGKQTAILTNGHRNAKLDWKLELCHVDRRKLGGLWGAEDIPALKPNPLAMQPICEKYPGLRLIYIGDAESDQRMAAAAGVDFLQVLTGKDQPVVAASISSLRALIQLLE